MSHLVNESVVVQGMEVNRIQDLPMQQRPRERLMSSGPKAMSNIELLAIILRTGTQNQSAIHLAQNVLQQAGNLAALQGMSIEELTEIKGIGKDKAVQIVASMEFGKRITQTSIHRMGAILTPEDCFHYLSGDMKHLMQEHFVVLFLDTKNCIIGKQTIAIGSLNKAIVHPREVFKEAIKRSAATIICAHNHPSGIVTPSSQDIQLTHRLEEVGELVGIKLLDHLIIGDKEFMSLKEKGYL